MVNVTETAQQLSNDYVALGNYIGLATGNPGSTSAPAHEASGGTPAYARVPTTWTPSSPPTGINQGSTVTINVPAGTYTYMILCSGPTGHNMIDNCPIDPMPLNGDGQIALTPIYQQS